MSGPARCPLCWSQRRRPSWLGVRRHDGREYRWVECTECGSSYYDPIPAEAVLRGVYGPDYLVVNQSADAPGSPKNHAWVIDTLRRRPAGVFVDYGCGAGDLLQKAARIGWDARGVELNEDVAQRVAAAIGLPVTCDPESLRNADGAAIADVVHLGDVMEHFADIDAGLDRALALLKPGGELLIQGPLAAGTCLFDWCIRFAGRLRPNRIVDAPPTYVVASARRGIERLLERRRLRASEFVLTEVAWPGPWRWESTPKAVALFALRRISQAVSRLAPERLGNRYRLTCQPTGRS